MSTKTKKKKSRGESTQLVRVKNALLKHEANSPAMAVSLKELGFSEKKFKRHLELLEAEKIIKREGDGNRARYWIKYDKLKPKKKSNMKSFMILWFGMIIFLFLVFIVLGST